MSKKRLGAGGRHRRRSWLRRRWLLLAGALGIGAAALRRSRAAGDSADHAERASRRTVPIDKARGRAKEVGRLIVAAPARLAPVAKRALEVAGGTAVSVRGRLRRQQPVGDSAATAEPAEPLAAEASVEAPAAKATSSRSGGRSRARKANAGTHQTSTGEVGTGDGGTEDASTQRE